MHTDKKFMFAQLYLLQKKSTNVCCEAWFRTLYGDFEKNKGGQSTTMRLFWIIALPHYEAPPFKGCPNALLGSKVTPPKSRYPPRVDRPAVPISEVEIAPRSFFA